MGDGIGEVGGRGLLRCLDLVGGVIRGRAVVTGWRAVVTRWRWGLPSPAAAEVGGKRHLAKGDATEERFVPSCLVEDSLEHRKPKVEHFPFGLREQISLVGDNVIGTWKVTNDVANN